MHTDDNYFRMRMDAQSMLRVSIVVGQLFDGIRAKTKSFVQLRLTFIGLGG